MKNRNLFKFSVIVLSAILLISSCQVSSNPTAGIETAAPGSSMVRNAINFIGDVSRIMETSANSRFYDGQIVKISYGSEQYYCTFKSYLVEYNSLNEDFIAYIDSNQKEYNSLFHHGYDIEYDPTKRYVEFSIYSDIFTNKPVQYELRVGNPAHYSPSSWYSKASSFNTDFTYDYTAGRQIDLKFDSFVQEKGENVYFSSRDLYLKRDTSLSTVILSFSTFADKECILSFSYMTPDNVWHEGLQTLQSGEGYYYLELPQVSTTLLYSTCRVSLEDEDGTLLDSFEVAQYSNASYLLEQGMKDAPEGYTRLIVD